jgi:diguanylate cyclase (GGDEF)-like protein/putative nucleotidyltransferase with HDIG domain
VDQGKPQRLPSSARFFVAAVGLVGFAAIFLTFRGWTPQPHPRFLLYLFLALATAGMKVALPGVQGTISVRFVFTMLGLVELTMPETLVLAIAGAATQTCWHAKGRVKAVYLFFNTSSVALAVVVADWLFHRPWLTDVSEGELLRLALAGVAYFVVNSVLLATIIALTGGQKIQTVIRSFCDWSLCYYLVGVSLAGIVHEVNLRLGWAFSLLLLPPLYLIYRSVRVYFGKMEQEKVHAENTAALHLRTIEALATAIEAKDECTGDHLRRVQVYSLEVARHLGLSPDEVHALQAASILHDIGKLAVPDYIISKPGKLTPAEFERMKVHTVVGAEILEQVAFPYPVAPIVRSHHEKWDGSGYPDGLKAESIPIGARILSAVDCLDALASDRQYRRALPLDEAMEYVAGLSGRSFDPQVIEILKGNYREFESLAQCAPLRVHKLSKDLIVTRGEAPDAGYEKSAPSSGAPGAGATPVDAIAGARQEIRLVVDLAIDISKSLRMGDILSILAERLKLFVPFDCMAIYVRERSVLKPCYTTGVNSQFFASLEIPMGQGLSGWVVENGKAIINGNPTVEPGYVEMPGERAPLHSALSIPLGDGMDHMSGALTLYREEKDAYSADHLRILLAVKSDIARAVDGAIRFEKSQEGNGIDQLTGLPTRDALIAYLNEDFTSQSKPVTVLLCDIDDFRRVNELYGRSTGDELLKLTAKVLRNHSRSGDYVARVGGDEFVLVMAAVRADDLGGKTASLDRLVANACRGLCGEENSGLVAGVACFPENGADAASLLAFAEQALGQAKETRLASRNVMLQLDVSLRQPA